MLRLVLIFFSAAILSLLGLYLSDGVLVAVFQKSLDSFTPVAILFSALSFALYSSVDGVMKDIPNDRRRKHPQAYFLVINRVTKLKKEIIANVVLVMGVLVLAKILYGLEQLVIPNTNNFDLYGIWVILSLRIACLTVCLYAAVSQCLGFFSVSEFRSVLKHGD